MSEDQYKVLRYARAESTNSIAFDLGGKGAAHGTAVAADEQSGGRGRGSRSFASPAGGLYLSVILRPWLPPEKLSLITLAAGVACAEAIEEISSVPARLKWPNDLYCQGRKLGGILTESAPYSPSSQATVPFVVVGIGINVNTRPENFPDLLRDQVISLYSVTTTKYDLCGFADSLIRSLLAKVRLLSQKSEKVLAQWQERDYLLGRKISWQEPAGRIVQGTGCGLLPDGRYLLADASGREHPVLAGDIAITDVNGQRIK